MPNRFNVTLLGGSGALSISPEPGSTGMYDVTTMITVVLTPDSGFTFVNWTIKGVVVGTNPTIVVEMGRSDILLVGTLVGTDVPDFTYGLRLWTEHVDTQNKKTRLTLEQKDYAGASSEMISDSLRYSIGNMDASPVEPIITSQVIWNYMILPDSPNLDFLLTSDPREFRVTYYRGYVSDSVYDWVWVGYLKPSFSGRPEYKTRYKIQLTATDGLSDLKGYKARVAALNYTDAMTILAAVLKQTYKDPLPIKESVRVFETRMVSGLNKSLFNQFTINQDFIYKDEARFQAEGTQIVFNPSKDLYELLSNIVKSFVARLYQWNGHWHIVRVNEYLKPSLTFCKFNTNGVFVSQEIILNNQEFACIGNPFRKGEDDFNEFNVSLNLGSINRPEERSIITDDFGILSWYNPNPGRSSTLINSGNTLRFWEYINAVQFDGNRDSEVARIERVSNDTGVFPRFWGTANGLSDPQLSGMAWRFIEYNSTVKNADALALSLKFQVKRRHSSDRRVPFPNSHLAVLQISIGINYLSWDGATTFTWVTTPTKITIPIENTDAFNSLEIPEVTVPQDGKVELVLYQLVTVSGPRHRYIIDWDDIRLDLRRNDSLTYTKREAKAITNSQYSNVHPEFEVYIGDALTNLASAAIVLKDVAGTPVSEGWAREGITEIEPHLGIVLQDLVNIFGKNNYSISATTIENEHGPLDFSKAIEYKNKKCVILAAELDDRTGIWESQIYELE